MPATTKQNRTSDLKSQAGAERTSGSVSGTPGVAVSGNMARGAGGISLASSLATNWVAVAVAGGAAGLLNLTTRKKSAFGYKLALAWRWCCGV